MTQQRPSPRERTDRDNPVNPYTPSIVHDADDAVDSPPDEGAAPTLGRVIRRWTLVCGLAAVPSFVLGAIYTSGQFIGMLMGVVVFIAAYVGADIATQGTIWRRNETIRKTLMATYGFRMFISIVFPIGFYMDMFCGVISIPVTQFLLHKNMKLDVGDRADVGVAEAFVATLIQGVSLNIVLSLVGILVVLPIVASVGHFRRGRKNQLQKSGSMSDPIASSAGDASDLSSTVSSESPSDSSSR